MKTLRQELITRTITSCAIVLVVGILYWWSSYTYNILLIALFIGITCHELPLLVRLPRYAYPLFVIVYPSISLLALAIINHQFRALNHWTPLYPLFVAASADTGGYFVGKFIGRHKMCPRISPGKTWEGFAGSVLAVYLLHHAVPGLFSNTPLIWLTQTGLGGVVIAVLMASISFLGGFVLSLFKRSRGVKDAGTLLPGHGGLLDRADSLLFTAPFTLFLVILLRK